MSVSVKVDDEEVLAAFHRLVAAGGNPTRALNSIGRYGKTSTQLRFDKGIDPEGKRWRPSLRVKRTGGQTLRGETGLLRNTILYRLLPASGGVEWGSNMPYAAIHQFGFDGPQKVAAFTRPVTVVFGKKLRNPVQAHVKSFTRHMRMPKRSFLGINSADRQALIKILTDQLAEQLRR